MDGSQFDQLVRKMANGHSRRSVVKGLAGSLVAAAASIIGGRTASADHKESHCAKEGQKAQPHKGCCPGLIVGVDGRCELDPCAGVVCEPQDDCHLAGACNPETGSCFNPVAPEGTPCGEDGGTCDGTGNCQSGGCGQPCSTSGPDCPAPCTVCHEWPIGSGVGTCQRPEGTCGGLCGNPYIGCPEECNDCVALPDGSGDGTCQTPTLCTGVVCEPQDDCHLAGTCDFETGDCSNPAAPEGTPCGEDGDTCDGAGNCQPSQTCQDPNDACHPVLNCGANGNSCYCFFMADGSARCIGGGACAVCTTDDDCTSISGPGSSCLEASECCLETQRVCYGPCLNP